MKHQTSRVTCKESQQDGFVAAVTAVTKKYEPGQASNQDVPRLGSGDAVDTTWLP